jgi:F0F1-type ATP synthase membrane subunit b/b'
MKTLTTLAFAVSVWAAPAFAQPSDPMPPEEKPPHAEQGASETGEHPAGHAMEGGEEEHVDPSRSFNFFGYDPGKLFDYKSKDATGGPVGDNQMTEWDPQGHPVVVHEEEPGSPPFVLLLLNFAVVLFILAKFGAPVARKTAVERHDLIKNALDEAAKLRKQAADRLAEYEARLKKADDEVKALVAGIRADAEADKARILAAAEVSAQQMKKDAEQRIAAEIELARRKLTQEVTAAAAAATERLLRDKTTGGDQEKLVADFIKDVQARTQKAAQ